jgi:membrane protein DedA with SNARE-associated domain
MAELGARLVGMLQAGAPWLGPLLALAAFAEALVVIGLFVPVTPLLVALGAGIASGLIRPGLLLWIMAGAFLGAFTSYELGRQFRARGRPAPRLRPKAQAAAQVLFQRHGAAAIVLARFMGPPATVTPFLAGWSGLPRGRFAIANAVASVAWPPAMLAVGALGALMFTS